VAVRLPLDDPDRTADQAWLAEPAYTLTVISYPKRGWRVVAGTRHDCVTGPEEAWCAVRPRLDAVAPHHLDRRDLDPDEMAVLRERRPALPLSA
jgi:hypothetical protein